MATLYEIDKAIEQVIDTGFSWDEETGEILFDTSNLEELQVAFKDKLENCGLWIKNQTALANDIRAEEKALAERRRAIESRIESMKAYTMAGLVKLDGAKLETAKLKLSTRKTSRVVVEDEAKVPDQFKQTVTTVKVSKSDLAAALKKGEVEGAYLEVGQSLQVK